MKIDFKSEEAKNDIMTIDFPSDISYVHFISLKLEKDNKVVSDNFYWRSNKTYEGPWTTTGPEYDGFESLMSMSETEVKMTISNTSSSGMEVKLENQTNKIAFFNRIKILDSKDNLIRPVIYSDNYFSLLPKSEKVIRIDIDLTNFTPDEVRVVLESVNLK